MKFLITRSDPMVYAIHKSPGNKQMVDIDEKLGKEYIRIQNDYWDMQHELKLIYEELEES